MGSGDLLGFVVRRLRGLARRGYQVGFQLLPKPVFPADAVNGFVASGLDTHIFHSARAELLRRSGSRGEAAKSYSRALELVTNDSERRYLKRRLREVQASES